MKEEFVEIKLPWLCPDEPAVEVVGWLVEEGQAIEIDQDILSLLVNGEEFLLPAPVDGTIVKISVFPGDLVSEGEVLAVVKLD